MQVKIFYDISEPYLKHLKEWKGHIVWSGKIPIRGKYNTYSFLSDSLEHDSFSKRLITIGAAIHMQRKEYVFSIKDIENADFLRVIIENSVESDGYVNYSEQRCGKCNNILPVKEKLKKVIIKNQNTNDYRIMLTYPSARGGSDIIIDSSFRNLLIQNGFEELEYAAVFECANNIYHSVDNLFQLSLPVGIGDAVPPTEIDSIDLCQECKFYKMHTIQSPLHFDKSSWTGCDLFFTNDFFGGPSPYLFRGIVCTKKFYNLIVQNNIQGISFEPCFIS